MAMRRVLAMSAVVTALLAAGALTWVVVTSGSAARSPWVITVANLANLAATAAVRQPDVRPGQWVYRKTLAIAPPGRSVPRLVTVERWATADGSKEALYFHGQLVVVPVTPAVGVLPYSSLGSLPTDPHALVARLTRLVCTRPAGSPLPPCLGHQDVFIGIGTMLGSYVMPPKITADLYRALADIPGVRIDRNAVDIAGRHGIGFAYPLGHGTVQEVIINSRTYMYMGSYFGVNVPASKADGEALLRQTFVSGPGVRP